MTDDINERSKADIEKIYDGDLSFKEIKNNPVLKPIAIINNSYANLELTIRKALWDLEQDRKKMDSLIEANPKYSETIIMNVINSMIRNTKTIIHAQDLQKDDMVNTIREMININKEEYALLNDEYIEQEEEVPPPIKKIIKIEEEPIVNEEKIKEIKKIDADVNIPQDIVEEEIEDKEKKFYSDFLEKEVSVSDKSDGFTPIKKRNK